MGNGREFETIGIFAIAIEAFAAKIAKDESWIPQIAHLVKSRGLSCLTFHLAAKVMNLESQLDLKEKVDNLYSLISTLKEITDQLPPERFWEENFNTEGVNVTQTSGLREENENGS